MTRRASTSASVYVTPSSAARAAWSFVSMTRSSAIGGDLLLLLGDELELRLGLGVRKVAASFCVRIRLSASRRRQPSMARRSTNSSLVIDLPLTLPTEARWSLYQVSPAATRRMTTAMTTTRPKPRFDVEVASILALPRGTVGALGDGFGSEGHVT